MGELHSEERPSTLVCRLLWVVILAQALLLAGIWIRAHLPLWTGQEIILKTRPVDPRSLFRGHYARLNYDISRIPARDLEGRPRQNERVYVLLKSGADGSFEYVSAALEPPKTGLFIQGRVQFSGVKTHRIRYGIEAYFAPPERARALERILREDARARVFVSPSGRATLQTILGSPP